MRQLVLYIHGKGGNAMEADHYKTLFSGCDVIGIDYHADNPWDVVFQDKFITNLTSYRKATAI